MHHDHPHDPDHRAVIKPGEGVGRLAVCQKIPVQVAIPEDFNIYYSSWYQWLWMKQGSSDNDGRSDVYDRLEDKVISNCCYNNCCRTNCSHFTWFYLNLADLPEFSHINLHLPEINKNLPEYTWIYLNLHEFTWIPQIYLNLRIFTYFYLNLPKFTWIYLSYLKFTEFTWIYLNLLY